MKKPKRSTSRRSRQAKTRRAGRRKQPRSRDSRPCEEIGLRAFILSSLRETVASFVDQLVHDELVSLVGEPWSRKGTSPLRRNGSCETTIVMDGEPYAFQRPRVRNQDTGREVPLASVKALQSRDVFDDEVKRQAVRGVSTRDYEGTLTTLSEGLGLKKSAVSQAFQRAAQKDLDELNGRRLEDRTFPVVFIDGIHFKDVTCLVALGITSKGQKVILGIREGATENSTVVRDLLEDLMERGLTLTEPSLFVLDGSKALRKAVRQVFGRQAVVQRCVEHKKRNVLSYLPLGWQREARRRLNAAWGLEDADEAEQALRTLLRWLRQHSESAARSLEEGLAETLTIHRLGVTGDLRRILKTTNSIESTFGRVRELSRRVKHWRGASMVMRWVGSGLVRAQAGFRRIKGYRDMPSLIAALKTLDLTQHAEAA